jgi:hypothetical protein
MAHIIHLGSTPLTLLTSATKCPFSSHISFPITQKRNIVYKFVGLKPTFSVSGPIYDMRELTLIEG